MLEGTLSHVAALMYSTVVNASVSGQRIPWLEQVYPGILFQICSRCSFTWRGRFVLLYSLKERIYSRGEDAYVSEQRMA